MITNRVKQKAFNELAKQNFSFSRIISKLLNRVLNFAFFATQLVTQYAV